MRRFDRNYDACFAFRLSVSVFLLVLPGMHKVCLGLKSMYPLVILLVFSTTCPLRESNPFTSLPVCHKVKFATTPVGIPHRANFL